MLRKVIAHVGDSLTNVSLYDAQDKFIDCFEMKSTSWKLLRDNIHMSVEVLEPK